MWSDGIFPGVKGTTGEFMIGDKLGIWRTRTLRRKVMEERWSRENLDLVGGIPWRISDGDPKGDGEPMKIGLKLPEAEKTELVREAEEREKAPRRFPIERKDLEDFGFTQGCQGCKAILKKTARQGHSEECRRRLGNLMGERDKVKMSKDKVDKFVEEKLEKEEELRMKKRAKTEEKDKDGDEKRGPSASGLGDEERKRGLEAQKLEESEASRRKVEEAKGEKRERGREDGEDEAQGGLRRRMEEEKRRKESATARSTRRWRIRNLQWDKSM